MTGRRDEVWKNEWIVKRFLEGVRGGIPYASDQIEVMLRVLGAGGRPISTFMDLGSGSGLLAVALLTQYPDARATLVDFSEPMMEAARDLLGEDASTPCFIMADFAVPGWVDRVEAQGPFDAIVSGFAIHYMTDERKRALFGELLELLAPGGFFIDVEHVASSTPWVSARFDDALIDSITAYQAQMGTGKNRRQVAHEHRHRPDESANILAPVETQCGWLRAAGFLDVDCYFKYFELAVFGGRKPG